MLEQTTTSDLGHFSAVVSTWSFGQKNILIKDRFGVRFNLAGATFQSYQKIYFYKKEIIIIN